MTDKTNPARDLLDYLANELHSGMEFSLDGEEGNLGSVLSRAPDSYDVEFWTEGKPDSRWFRVSVVEVPDPQAPPTAAGGDEEHCTQCDWWQTPRRQSGPGTCPVCDGATD